MITNIGKFDLQSEADVYERFGEELGNVLLGEKRELNGFSIARNLYKISDTNEQEKQILAYLKVFASKVISKTYHKLFKEFLEEKTISNITLSPNVDTAIERVSQAFGERVAKRKKKHKKKTKHNGAAISNEIVGTQQPGYYPEATCKLQELRQWSTETEKLIQLHNKVKEDSKKRDPELAKKKRQGRITKATYIDNRVAELDASPVKITPHVDFILAGCPFEDQLATFIYETVIQRDCTLWFSLNQIGERKVTPFWLNKSIKELQLADGWKVQNVTQSDESFDPSSDHRLVTSVLKAARGENAETKEMEHIYYKGWEDHNPAPDDALLLKCATIAKDHLQANKGPVGINCKAGVGRTGILATLIYAMRVIDAKIEQAGESIDKIEINIPELNYDLRRQRGSLIGRHEALQQVYRVLSNYVVVLEEKAKKGVAVTKIQSAFRTYLTQINSK